TFAAGQGGDLAAVFDWRQTGPQSWDIEIDTATGMKLMLSGGGTRLAIDGRTVVDEKEEEYAGIYRRFDALLTERASEVDDAPFRLVADAFMIGRRIEVEAFDDPAKGANPAL
ncbi:MAG: gfo/Idh/MocA family oxidoreductase, partial [Microvirga sp.]